jgi:outer membrane protein insertion porin family
VWWQEFTLGPVLYTAGFGMRFFITEQSPLTVGLGYPLNPKNKKDVRHFFFSIGLSF